MACSIYTSTLNERENDEVQMGLNIEIVPHPSLDISLYRVQAHHLKGFKTIKMLQVLRTQLVLFGWEKLIIKNVKSPHHQYVLWLPQQNIEQLQWILGAGKHNKRTMKMNDIVYLYCDQNFLAENTRKHNYKWINTCDQCQRKMYLKCITRKHMHGMWISLDDSSNDVELAFLCEVCHGSKPN